MACDGDGDADTESHAGEEGGQEGARHAGHHGAGRCEEDLEQRSHPEVRCDCHSATNLMSTN